jgi:hypothetical protein
MTPKEKADDLVKKMYAVHSNTASDITLYFAKQCALIAVDEIMKAVGWEEMELGVDRDNYWEEVKQEIEKL